MSSPSPTLLTAFLTDVRTSLSHARTFVFPVECAGCGNPDARLCESCTFELRSRPQLLAGADRPPGVGVPVISGGPFDQTIARVLHALKDTGRTGLAHDLAPRLNLCLAALDHHVKLEGVIGSRRFVVPPSSRANRRERGFEPLELIARRARVTLWWPLDSARRRDDQAALGAAARKDNMRHSMRVRSNVSGASIVLIDDVMTTGATLAEMVRVLHQAGARVEAAVVLAHAVRRWPDRQHAHPENLP